MRTPASIHAGIHNYVFRRTISLMTNAPSRIDMQPRSKLIETDHGGGTGWAMTEIRPRTIYSVPGFSMTSAVSIIRPDVPAFATRSASRREVYITMVNPVTEGIWRNSTEMLRVLPSVFISRGSRLTWYYNRAR